MVNETGNILLDNDCDMKVNDAVLFGQQLTNLKQEHFVWTTTILASDLIINLIVNGA